MPSRAHVIQVLRAAALRLMAGTVAYPPKMYEDIAKRVELQLASWSLFTAAIMQKDLEGELELLQPKATTEMPRPKFSPAVWKMIRTQAEILTALRTGKVPTSRLAKRASDAEILKSFENTLAGKRGMAESEAFPKPTPPNPKIDHQLVALSKAKTLDGMDDDLIKVVKAVIWTVAYTAYSNAAEKAARILHNYQQNKRELEGKKTEGPAKETSETQAIRKKLEDLEVLKAYCEKLGGRPESPTKARSRVKIGGATVAWTIPLDLTGLPENYPLNAAKPGSEITVEVMAATANYNGFWREPTKTMRLLLQRLPRNKDDLELTLMELKETIRHELAHMVQYIMQESLKRKFGPNRSVVERAGGPFSPRHPVTPGVDDADADAGHGDAGDDDEDVLKKPRDRYAALRKTYPRATDQELYFLSPREFFPQVGTWVQRFMTSYVSVEDRKDPAQRLKRWKDFVGIDHPARSDFYTALKLHDKRLWKRAVSEGWVKLNKRLAEAA